MLPVYHKFLAFLRIIVLPIISYVQTTCYYHRQSFAKNQRLDDILSHIESVPVDGHRFAVLRYTGAEKIKQCVERSMQEDE